MSNLKCANCNSEKVQVKAWVDANTGIFISDIESDNPYNTWCSDCETHSGFVEDLNKDSGDILSDSWFEKADEEYEAQRDQKGE